MKAAVYVLFVPFIVGIAHAVWTTVHHDELNRGFANGMKGPVNSPPCNTSIQAEDRTHEIYQTGVVSTNNEYLVTGTSDNQLSVVDVETLQTYTIGILSDGGPDGIVGAAVSKILIDVNGSTTDEVAVVGSTDGHVYMIPYEACIRNGDSPCYEIWKTDVGAPVYAPVRCTTQGTLPGDNLPEGVTIVGTSSNYETDEGGNLVALNTSDGSILWQREARDDGNNTYALRHTPAMDYFRRAIVHAYGPVLELVDIVTGAQLAQLDTNETSVQDEFYSAPVLGLDADRIYIQSKRGYLWAIDVVGDRNATLSVAYRCKFDLGTSGLAESNCTWPGHWRGEEDDSPLPPASQASVSSVRGTNRFSTPALNIDDGRVTLATYNFNSGGALVQVSAATGQVVWSYTGRQASDKGPQFGNSRSSPALDEDGNVFVGSDAVDGPYEIPTLWAFGPDGEYKWSVALAGDDIELGPISPVIANGNVTRGRVYMATFDDIYAFEEGCPAGPNGLSCNGTGTCLCQDDLKEPVCQCVEKSCSTGPACADPFFCVEGTCVPGKGCVCEGCFTGPDCKTPLDCGEHGTCDSGVGVCECDSCYSGEACDVQQDCNGNGTCNAGTGVCECNACYSGDSCQVFENCNGNGKCDAGTGYCSCEPCFTEESNCADAVQCPTNQTCNAMSGQCACEPCFTEDSGCTEPVNCNAGTCNGQTGECDCPDGYDSTTNCAACLDCLDPETGCQSYPCSGHGTCQDGNVCTCKDNFRQFGDYGRECIPCPKCFSGPECFVEEECNLHGTCLFGTCQCHAGYDPATKCFECNSCATGPDCTVCSNRGYCIDDKCECDGGWTGQYCQKSAKKNGGAIAGGVIATVVLVGAAGGFFLWYRYNPGRPFTDIFSDMSTGINRGFIALQETVQPSTAAVDKAAVNTYTSSGGGGYGSTASTGAAGGTGGYGSTGGAGSAATSSSAAGTGSYSSL